MLNYLKYIQKQSSRTNLLEFRILESLVTQKEWDSPWHSKYQKFEIGENMV